MKVKELIEKLRECKEDSDVYIVDDGMTYRLQKVIKEYDEKDDAVILE